MAKTAISLDDLDAQIEDLRKKRQQILDEQREDKLKEIKNTIKQFGFTAADLDLVVSAKRRKGLATKNNIATQV